MKIVIAGNGKVGAVLADQLSALDHDVIVIDNIDQNLMYVENTLDVMCVSGNAASMSVLREIDIETCDLLIAMTGSDETNLVICLIAKKLGVTNTIARIRNPLYADSVNLIKEDMGLSMAINPEYEAALEIFRTLRFKSAGQVETLANTKVEVITCKVVTGTPVCGVQIKDVYKKVDAKIFICGVKREGNVFIPNGDTTLMDGDVISFVASPEDTHKFFKQMGYGTNRVSDITIIGGGRLAYYLSRMCLENGIPVKIIEKQKENCINLKDLLPGAEIILGDGTDTQLLDEEGVLNSAAVATATGVDATNLMISMYLSQNAPNAKLITKIKKSDFQDIMANINVGSVFYPKYITADKILKYISAMDNSLNSEMQSIYHVIDNQVEILEFLINPTSINLSIPIQELDLKSDILLANITRDGQDFIPGGTDTIESGDTLLVVTTRKDIKAFRDVFEW